jgi:hypothetical protein
MAKYFIDTEFIEDFTHPWIGKSRHYIDLISIGIVAEDGREFYGVSKEFDIDYVWNKFQWKHVEQQVPNKVKEYWLRDNVLMPIYNELAGKDLSIEYPDAHELRRLIRKYGKSNKQIAQDIEAFCSAKKGNLQWAYPFKSKVNWIADKIGEIIVRSDPEFYGYYSDYDWVLFCSLYGRMLDLPKGFPMYCNDLKQALEDKNHELRNREPIGDLEKCDFHSITVEFKTQANYHQYQGHNNYPKQTNSHNSLADAKWNKQLYDFLKTI